MIEDQVISTHARVVGSFESFYRVQWLPVFRAVAVGLNDADLAREATDEAMVRAYERWRAVSGMSNPEGWVFRVAMNWAASRLRRRKLRVREIAPEGVSYPPEPTEPGLARAVKALPRKQRDVVIARYLLDLSEAETAKALDIPVGTVKSRLSRALTSLREELT